MSSISRRRFLEMTAVTAGAALLPRAARAEAAPEKVRVAVIGGGLAGLTAARRLVAAGIGSVVVLEARDRVGGRTLNMPIGGGYEVEFGGEWIGPGQERMAALAAEVGVKTFDAYYDGDTTYDIEGLVSRGFLPDLSVKQGYDFIQAAWKLDRAAKRLPQGATWNSPDAAALDKITLGDWLRQNTDTTWSYSVFRLITRAIMSGYPERISLLWFLHYLNGAGGILPLILNDGGAQDLRFAGGSQLVSIRMAEQLGGRVRLRKPVHSVAEAGEGRLAVTTFDQTFLAEHVIVAMAPPDTLRIRFSPALPAGYTNLAWGWARLPKLPIVKLAVIYKTPFWRAKGLNGAMQSDVSPLQLIFDNSPPDGSMGVLSCFMSVAEAPHLADRSAREAGVVKELVRYFGTEAAKPVGYLEKDWAVDPWTASCITPLTPGILSTVGPMLRRPVGRIHWAGTESAEQWCGFMDGAVRSGEHAAAEVAAALKAG